MEELSIEAKKRYPVGTKFRPAHLNIEDKDYCIITENTVFENYNNTTMVARDPNTKYPHWDDSHKKNEPSKFGNTSFNRYVYYKGKWAKILESPKEEFKPFYVKVIKNAPNCTSHPRYQQSAPSSDLLKYKVIEHDNESYSQYGGVYICKEGYCFYADCCQKVEKDILDINTFTVYHVLDQNNEWIVKVNDLGTRIGSKGQTIYTNCDWISLKDKNDKFGRNTDFSFNCTKDRIVKEATQEQKHHLEICINSSKYVELESKKEKVNSNTDFVFIPNKVYVREWGARRAIFKLLGEKLAGECYMIDADNNYSNQIGVCTGSNISFREATIEESDWLERCIKAGKTVPKEQDNKSSNLRGRWVRLVKHEIYDSLYYGLQIGYYDFIEADFGESLHLKTFKSCDKGAIGKDFELMPEGFTPQIGTELNKRFMKFKIGDSVKILNVLNYKTDHNDNIPRNLIIHGSTTLHPENPNARIVDIYKEFYIINFINDSDRMMQLGYLEKDLELISVNKLSETIYNVAIDPYQEEECSIKPQIDAEVKNVRIKEKVPVTLKNTEKEVKINVKTNYSVKLN